ncbi:helix-turn-helix transcriptional regulator [Agrobacterium rhizogenes]|nr:helix-turn-helix transcriptional regulator [Rhizobium rhizogenes]
MSSINLAALNRAFDRSLEAAFDPSIWKEVITGIADATRSFGANIIPASNRNPDMVVHTDSMDGPFEDYFNDGWHQNEWRLRGLPFVKRNGAVRDHQYTSREDFEKHPYFKLHAKYGVGGACMIGWNVHPDDPLILTLHRRLGSDAYSDEEVAIFIQMRERLMVSASIMRQLSVSRIDGMSDAFEMAGMAAIFFDRFGKVTRVTSGAERLLGTELTISNRELKSRKHEETMRIRNRMQAVLGEKWLLVDPKAPGPVSIERESGRPIYIRIQRLGGNMPDFFSQAVGVCLLEDGQAKKPAAPEAFQTLFNLTPKQAFVLSKLCEGLSLREIADACELSYETARTHLRAIFAKTKTGRQSELIALANKITPGK